MRFVDLYIRWFTGKPGAALFEIIKSNQFQITLIVALYGLILAIASYNYRKVIPKLTETFFKKKALLLSNSEGISNDKLSSALYLEWIKMIDKLPKYFFIPNKNNSWIVFPNGKIFAERLNVKEVYIKNIINTME